MDRNTFLRSFTLAAAGAAIGCSPSTAQKGAGGAGRASGLVGGGVMINGSPLGGVRRLESDKNFTLWEPDMEPAYEVEQGELVLVEMSHGLPGLVTRDGTFRKAGPGDKVNPQTGPIFVKGIEPGDALAIDIYEVRVGDWGYSGGRIFELVDGYAVFDDKLRLPLSPMIGGIGVAPASGSVDTKRPGHTGGNMDCKEVRAGSTLIFTARVPGGLVGMGDTHALQGDGEIRGQGIETDAQALVRFRRLPAGLSERPVIIRPEFVATLSALEDLNEAAWEATDDMTAIVGRVTGREREDARMLVNLLGDLKISQIVDPTKGARMELPRWALGV